MSDWEKCKLGDVADRIGMGPFGSNIKVSTFVNEGIPVISGTHLRGIRLEDKEYNFITVEHANKLQSANVYRGDVVFTHAGNIGQVAFIPTNSKFERYIISQRQFYLRCRKDVLTPEFLTYYFRSNEGQYQLLANANQTGVPSLAQPVSYLKTIEILLPPLPEQYAIAGVLSSRGDKIDLLRQQNKTLERMAEALWRKMFVEDADPGWKRGNLGDYGEFKNGINYSRNENGATEYSILNVRDIVESKYVNVSNFEKVFINNIKATPYLLDKGDIVIVRSASPGESLIVLEEIDDLIYSGFSIRLRCYDKTYSPFLFQFLQSYKKEMDIFSDGTTLKNINQGILNSIELITPAKDTVEEFNDRVFSVYNKLLLNQRQIRTLSHLRDTLLPKLMSGKVRVKYFS